MPKESNMQQYTWQWWGDELYSILFLESLQVCEMTKLIRNKSIVMPVVTQCFCCSVPVVKKTYMK